MLDRAKDQERLDDWARRNGIDLADEEASLIGYWCRVAGVPLDEEAKDRKYRGADMKKARDGWMEADEEIRAELIKETPDATTGG
jgi:hypothetical protein